MTDLDDRADESSALALTVTRLKGEWRGAEGQAFDYTGTLIYMGSLFCLIIGVSHLIFALLSMVGIGFSMIRASGQPQPIV